MSGAIVESRKVAQWTKFESRLPVTGDTNLVVGRYESDATADICIITGSATFAIHHLSAEQIRSLGETLVGFAQHWEAMTLAALDLKPEGTDG